MKSQLYGLTGTDPWSIVIAAAVILFVGALSGFIPATRAVRINPTIALRYE